jgi:hypothetical protein
VSNVPGFTPLADLNLQPGDPIFGILSVDGVNPTGIGMETIVLGNDTPPNEFIVPLIPASFSCHFGSCTLYFNNGTLDRLVLVQPQSSANIANNPFHITEFEFSSPNAMTFSFLGLDGTERLEDGTPVIYEGKIHGLGIVTPEPSTWATVGFALAVVLAARRGRRARRPKR